MAAPKYSTWPLIVLFILVFFTLAGIPEGYKQHYDQAYLGDACYHRCSEQFEINNSNQWGMEKDDGFPWGYHCFCEASK